jgi:hypothetical protein
VVRVVPSPTSEGNNFMKRHRVAVTDLLLSGQKAELSGPLEQMGSAAL